MLEPTEKPRGETLLKKWTVKARVLCWGAGALVAPQEVFGGVGSVPLAAGPRLPLHAPRFLSAGGGGLP